MKHIFTLFNQSIKKSLLLALALLAMSSNAWGDESPKPYYNNGTWYSLFDTSDKSAYIATRWASPDIATYSNIFEPIVGTFSLDSKLPGKSSSSSDAKQNDQTDPHSYDYGVTSYSLNVGGQNVSFSQNVSVNASMQSYTTGGFFTSKKYWYYYNYSYTYNYQNASGSGLGENTTSLTVTYNADNTNHGTKTVYISNIKVPLAKHIRLANGTVAGASSISKEFANTTIGNNSEPYTVNFRSFLTNGNITIKLTSGDKSIFRLGSSTNKTGEITSSKEGKTYAVGSNACASANGEVDACAAGKLGKIENYSFEVYFCPTEAKTYEGTITITDGKNTATITLKGTGDKMIPTVVWSPDEEIFNEEEVLTATNPQNLEVTLSSVGNEEYVGCNDNTATMLKQTNGNKIKIKAHVKGNEVYADADIEKEITITNLIKQYISWDNGGNLDRLKTTDASKTITLGAKSTSNLPISYELEGEKTGLTLTKHSDVKWTLTYTTECRNTTIVAMQAGNSEYAPAADYILPVRVTDPTKECDTTGTLVQSKITLKDESRTYRLEVPSTITINVNRTKTSWAIYSNGFNVEFYTSEDGSGKALRTEKCSAGDINTSKTISLTDLDVKIKSVKLISKASNGYDVTSVTYTKQKYCTLSESSLDFTANPKTTSSAQKLKVNYANYPIQLVCSNAKFTYTPTDFGDCGEFGNQEVSVTYTAGEDEGNDSGILYVYDNTGKELQKCTLNVTISKLPQEVETTTIATAYKSTDKITLSSTASSKLTDFVYSASPEGVASFKGAEMTFISSGTIAITATQPGDVTYKSASKTIQNVVVSAVTPDIADNPTATGVKCYGELSNSQLSGGKATVTLHDKVNQEIEGEFVWKNEGATVDLAAGTHEFAVVFKPNTTKYNAMFNDKEFTIQVDVALADASLAMKNDGEVDVTIPGDTKTLDLSSLIDNQTGDGSVTYAATGENASHVTIDGKNMSADAAGEYTIVATAAETEYYTSATSEPFTVTVNRRTPNVSVTGLNTVELTYGDALSSKGISGSVVVTDLTSDNTEDAAVTCAWTNEGADKPAVGVESATATFTSAHSEWFEPIEINVPIHVSPAAAKTYAATATISEGQSLNEVEFTNGVIGLFDETVSGTFSWANTVEPMQTPEVGTFELPVSFVSSDANYLNGTGVCTVTVEPATVWDGSQPENPAERVVTKTDVDVVGTISLGGLTINSGNTVTIKDGATLTIGDYNSLTRTTYGNIIVEAGGKLNLGEGEVQVNDFTLYSGFDGNKQPKSGQVTGQQKITTKGNAYFVLDLDSTGAVSYGWYSFTVPFPVDALRGISYYEGGEWHAMTNEVNYAIMDYHEGLRAQGKYGWKKYKGILQPGTGYLITVDDELGKNYGVNRCRFKMVENGHFNTVATQNLVASDGTEENRGWNFIGNGLSSYIKYDETPRYAQLLNHKKNVYEIIRTTNNSFVVGAAYVVQVLANMELTMLDASDATTGLLRAPQRDQAYSGICDIDLSLRANGQICDRLFVTCDEEATMNYTIGKDVQKMGTTAGASVARMWANAKGTVLGAVDMPFSGDKTIIPMSLYAPQAGEYTIAIDNNPTEDVYLTRNGVIVWELSMSEFTLDLNAGTDTSYALLVTRKVKDTATGVDALDSDKRGTDFVKKVIVNGQLFILHDGVMYDAQGKKVTTF